MHQGHECESSTLLVKKCAITFLLFAWICANGALLDVVQVFAWGKMFSGYAKSMSVSAALKETFDPARILNRGRMYPEL